MEHIDLLIPEPHNISTLHTDGTIVMSTFLFSVTLKIKQLYQDKRFHCMQMLWLTHTLSLIWANSKFLTALYFNLSQTCRHYTAQRGCCNAVYWPKGSREMPSLSQLCQLMYSNLFSKWWPVNSYWPIVQWGVGLWNISLYQSLFAL